MKRDEHFVWKRGTVTGIHPRDAFYGDRDRLVGMTGEIRRDTSFIPFYSSGIIRCDNGMVYNFFAAQFKMEGAK